MKKVERQRVSIQLQPNGQKTQSAVRISNSKPVEIVRRERTWTPRTRETW